MAAAPAAAAAGAGPTPVGNAAAPAKSYLPFSDGARDCVGQNLAVTEARAVLAALCGRFRLALAPGMGDRAAVRDQVGGVLSRRGGGGVDVQAAVAPYTCCPPSRPAPILRHGAVLMHPPNRSTPRSHRRRS